MVYKYFENALGFRMLIKIPLMVESFRQIDEGKFKLTDRVTIHDEDKRPGTGVIRSLDAGANLTIKDLLTLMIIVSDNTATDLMYGKIGGPEALNREMDRLGFKTIRAQRIGKEWFAALAAAPSRDEFHREGKTPFGLSSPREMGRLLEMIKRGQAVNKSASEEMLQIMRGQVYSTRMPKYVTGYRVPHKTGDFLPYVANDVGILESPSRNIVLCVFTAQHYGVGTYLEDAIGRVAELVGNHYGARE
jgi:beta-lactamase class A